MKLTDTYIRKYKLDGNAPKAGKKLTDGKGLYLHVLPTGGKVWRYQYRFNGKPKLISFGAYPEVSLAMARERLLEARATLAKEVDPSAARKAAKQAHNANSTTFESVFQDWLIHWKDGKSTRHVDYVERRVKADILPRIGQLPIAEIKAPTVVAMLKAIQERGVRDIAKRAYETTGQIFRYAVAHGVAERNPVADFKASDVLKSGIETNYARIDAKEWPAFLQCLEVYPGTHVTRLAIWLLALTFVRTSELIEAPWTEFDLEAGRWDIPAERMKMRSPHIVPLSTQALETLQSLHRLTGHTKWVLPGDRNPKQPMSQGNRISKHHHEAE